MVGLIIGLGSMGKRRARLLKKIVPEVKLIGVDSRADRRAEFIELYGLEAYETPDEALENTTIDFVIVSTAPLGHLPLTLKFLNIRIPVFSEINLSSEGYLEIDKVSRENSTLYFLSSTMLFRNDIAYIIDQVHKSSEKIHYQYHIGQYLPDWHPWEKVNDFFVSDKRTNGCREILAIELPWIIKAFGEITDCQIVKGEHTSLGLGYCDCYSINLIHESGHFGNLMVDVISRVPMRHFKLISENRLIQWLGSPETLAEYDSIKKELVPVKTYHAYEQLSNYANNIVEDAYERELLEFMQILQGNGISNSEDLVVKGKHYSLTEDLNVLSIIDRIEV